MPELRGPADGFLRASEAGVAIMVRVRPRSRPAVEVLEDAVVIRVASPAIDGRATEEARRALARALGVAASRVWLRGGRTSRTKVFEVRGLGSSEAGSRLRA